MKNIVTATIEFYFKGEKLSPSITIDLNEHLQISGSFPNLHALISSYNKIDHYSYEYEMMQSEIIKYSGAYGLVANYIVNGELDIENFVSAWQQKKIVNKLATIAEKYMAIKDLEQHPDLNNALMEAYNLGKTDTN